MAAMNFVIAHESMSGSPELERLRSGLYQRTMRRRALPTRIARVDSCLCPDTHFAIKCYGFGVHKEPHRAASLGIKDFALDCRSFCVRKHSILKQIGRIFEQIGAKLRTRAKSNSIPEESHVLFFIRGRARVRWADHLEFKG
jgi:hypothetical protein